MAQAIGRQTERARAGPITRPEQPMMAGDPMFDQVQTVIIGSNAQAARAAEEAARQLKFNTLLLTTQVQGEAREVAKVAAAIAAVFQA